MDAMEILRKKNEKHKKLLEKDRRFAVPLVINTFFVAILIYYELFYVASSGFEFKFLAFLVFVWLFYQFAIITFYAVFISNYYVKCATLILIHSVFLYMWIWNDDSWGVAFVAGLLFIAVWFAGIYNAVSKK